MQKIDKLIEEATTAAGIIKITSENNNQYYPIYKNIYEKQFHRKVSPSDFKKWLKSSHLIILPDGKDSGAFARCKHIKQPDKYCKFYKVPEAIFLSDIAAHPQHKGYGSKILKYIINKARKEKLPIITSPWKDTLIQYYESFGFKTIRPKDKNLPNVVMIKKA
jgi:GNAT superfamily N-acetyltransferase